MGINQQPQRCLVFLDSPLERSSKNMVLRGTINHKAHSMAKPQPKTLFSNLSPSQLFLLYLIFFVSGGSSLISEITWNRMLVLIVGNTVSATSTILVAFM